MHTKSIGNNKNKNPLNLFYFIWKKIPPKGYPQDRLTRDDSYDKPDRVNDHTRPISDGGGTWRKKGNHERLHAQSMLQPEWLTITR